MIVLDRKVITSRDFGFSNIFHPWAANHIEELFQTPGKLEVSPMTSSAPCIGLRQGQFLILFAQDGTFWHFLTVLKHNWCLMAPTTYTAPTLFFFEDAFNTNTFFPAWIFKHIYWPLEVHKSQPDQRIFHRNNGDTMLFNKVKKMVPLYCDYLS